MPTGPSSKIDIISGVEAQTLPGLYLQRVHRSPNAIAYCEYREGQWQEFTWAQMVLKVARFRAALYQSSLNTGDRVAILLPNGTDWVAFDIAAMANGLVTVPLYPHDSTDNIVYILANSGARLCLLDSMARWESLAPRIADSMPPEQLWVKDLLDRPSILTGGGRRLMPLSEVLDGDRLDNTETRCSGDETATIIYTSGTTDRPKGVALSHSSILWNAEAITKFVPPVPGDVFLSLLPLAHGFERTMGYYLPMMAGSRVAYARSIEKLREDLARIRPTVFLGVPRLYERIYEAVLRESEKNLLRRALVSTAADIGWRLHEWRRGRATKPSIVERLMLWPALKRLIAHRVLQVFGGRLRIAVSGGAALAPEVTHFLIGLGLPLVEGYGLTEAGPVVTATTLEDNLPGSVGRPLHGIEIKLGEEDELLVRTPAVMSGYWNDPQATMDAISPDGWLRTGDIVEIRDGRVFITRRLKDILVLSTGENVAPKPIEDAIQSDPLFEQVCIIGHRRPSLVAIAVVNPQLWSRLARDLRIDQGNPNVPAAKKAVLSHIAVLLHSLPSSSQVRAIHMVLRPWTVEGGILTPTLKIKRHTVEERFKEEIDTLYARLAKLRQATASGRRG
jgi:long-chain acyl-CoA synthetase